MNAIITAIKNIKLSLPFKNIRVINNKDKNGNKFIAILGVNTIFSEEMLKLDAHFKPLLEAVDSLENEDVTFSFTSPSKNTKQPGVGLLFIGKITEINLDDMTL